MADIFISYARSTAPQAQRIAEALRALGYRVWRDDELPAHRSYAEVIEERLKAAKAVVVIWSAEGVKSEWVQSEADRARNDRKLVQLSVDGTPLPMPFDRIQCADLSGWNGDISAPGWRKVVASVADLAGASSTSTTAAAAVQNERTGPSICVLPFANMSNDSDQEYFSDGISEDIITDLSKVRALTVISRNSAFTFKGKHVDLPEVARQLKVSHVLEGSVRKSGNRVRITAQLIDGATNGHVWAERYDRDLSDIFALQDEISQAIVAALKLKLFPEEQKAIQDRGTTSVEAYDLYLKANEAMRESSAASAVRAAGFYRRAAAIDPKFLGAWIGLASAATGIAVFSLSPEQAEAAMADSNAAIKQALALAPNEAEGLMLQGKKALLIDQDRDAAARIFSKLITAVQSAPSQTLGIGFDQFGYGQALANFGYATQAVELFKSIAAADPLSFQVSSQLQYNLDIAGRYDEAEAEYHRTMNFPGDHAPWEFQRVTRLWAQGAPPAAAKAQFERAVSMSSGFFPLHKELLALDDDPPSALALLRRAFDEPFYQISTRLNLLALYAAHHRDTDFTLAILRRAFVDQKGGLVSNLWNPLYAAARKDPRFKEIVRDIGLEPLWRERGEWGDFARPLGNDDFEIIR